MQFKIQSLRNRYQKFIYEKYYYEFLNKDLKISFYFKIEPDIFFVPKIIIKNVNKSKIAKIGDRVLNNLVFHLGLIELLSYWKATCSPEIEIRTGFLNKEQISWWKNLIWNGMGQFFYENRVNFLKPNFLKISAICESVSRNLYESGHRGDRVLAPIGGGKDSIVTLEILKKKQKDLACFSLNPNEGVKNVIKIAGCNNFIIVARKIDPKLLELNRRGFLNGHTPFSAYLAFLSVLLAAIFDYKYIAFSNERSSNEGNLKYLGKFINHQYSKSFDFEKKFRDYSKKYLAKNIAYFSFLRPLYEIQIAKLFSNFPQYFNAFLSCNEAYKTDSGTKRPPRKWCGKCPKCLFLFIILYPFLDEKKLLKIFGKNLFADKTLLPTMQQLVEEKGFKPFECVGTKKESLVALYLSWKKKRKKLKKTAGGEKVNLPFLLEHFHRKILKKYPNFKKESERILNSFANQNYLPKNFEKILKSYVSRLENKKPAPIKYLNQNFKSLWQNWYGERILILGFGKEGRDAFLFLRKLFPEKILGVGDKREFSIFSPATSFAKQNLGGQDFQFSNLIKKDKKIKWHLGKNYLKALKNYDVIIKSPGIPIHLPEIEKAYKEGKVVSPTKIFFENCPGKIVGITGTKGKSTTCALIYKILKEAGIKAHLAGNIGKPVLSLLFRAAAQDIYVYELSCHQLCHLKKSPQIAVFLNIYPEHLDYYRNFREYVNTKTNITRYQSKEDFLIYNSENKFVREIAKKSKAEKISIPAPRKRITNKVGRIPLVGEFNLLNLSAAISVGKIFKVSEEDIVNAIRKFKPLPHRLNYVGSFKGIKFYDDALSTIPETTIAALDALGKNVKTIILGGYDRGLDFTKLAKKILKSKVRNVILFPTTGKRIWEKICQLSQNKLPNNFFVNNMADAVKISYQQTKKGEICLLSTASPSFGLFRDYGEKGELFRKYIKKFR